MIPKQLVAVFVNQALAGEANVAPFVCGAVASDVPLFGGETWRGEMEVDLDACGDNPVFSMVGMLSE